MNGYMDYPSTLKRQITAHVLLLAPGKFNVKSHMLYAHRLHLIWLPLINKMPSKLWTTRCFLTISHQCCHFDVD